MFYSQFPLTKKGERGLRDAIFVVHVYLEAWFTAPVPTSAPRLLEFVEDLIQVLPL